MPVHRRGGQRDDAQWPAHLSRREAGDSDRRNRTAAAVDLVSTAGGGEWSGVRGQRLRPLTLEDRSGG